MISIIRSVLIDDILRCETQEEKEKVIKRANVAGYLVWGEEWEIVTLEEIENEIKSINN